MELNLTRDEKYCYRCKQVKNKRYGFIKGVKNCRNCNLNMEGQGLIVKVECLICLWSGDNIEFKNHNCIINENKFKNKIKYISFGKKIEYEFKKKDNPFLLFNN